MTELVAAVGGRKEGGRRRLDEKFLVINIIPTLSNMSNCVHWIYEIFFPGFAVLAIIDSTDPLGNSMLPFSQPFTNYRY